MKKLDPTVVTEKFNTLRLQYLRKSFDSEEFKKLLTSNGISSYLFTLFNKAGLFRVKIYGIPGQKGKYVKYAFQDTPVYVKQMEKILQDRRPPKKEEKTTSLNEQECIKFLKSKGYIILKNEGINEDALLKDHPEIYAKYLITHEI